MYKHSLCIQTHLHTCLMMTMTNNELPLVFNPGIGSGEADLSRCIELASRPVFLQQWKNCKHLVIDEVSMIDGLMFDKLEAVARFAWTIITDRALAFECVFANNFVCLARFHSLCCIPLCLCVHREAAGNVVN